MKKIINYLLITTLFVSLCGCQKTLKGTDALIEKAREEIPIADAENSEINYAGLCSKDDSALIWFISGNEYQAYTYLPMECNVVGKDEYTFERTYKPMDRGEDIAVLEWKGGYSFLINNPDCKTIRIIDNSGTHDIAIEKDVVPFVYYHALLPNEYYFLDKDGNQL